MSPWLGTLLALLLVPCVAQVSTFLSEVEQWEEQDVESMRMELLQTRVAVASDGTASGILVSGPLRSAGRSYTATLRVGGSRGDPPNSLVAGHEDRMDSRPGSYDIQMVKACAELAKAASCGPEPRLRSFRCQACHDAGFELVPGTSRMVTQAEMFQRDSTFVHVARLRALGALRQGHQGRQRQELLHSGEDCYKPCGSVGGYCAWCGVGNACCPTFSTRKAPVACIGASSFAPGSALFQCVAPAKEKQSHPVASPGVNCWFLCGQAGGYCSFCGPGNACCRQGYDNDPVECRDVVGFLTDSRHECVAVRSSVPEPGRQDFGCSVSIRGTQTTANKLNLALAWNEAITHEGCDGCRVFTGFWSIWKDIEPKVVSALEDNGCIPGEHSGSLLITGHSLGGALGTLAMLTLHAKGYKIMPSYNFESPRVGNEAFSRAFSRLLGPQNPLRRVTWKKDPVPHVPPQPLYRHVGSEVYFSSDELDSAVECDSEEDERCADRYNFLETLNHADYDEHCLTRLVLDNNMCSCGL